MKKFVEDDFLINNETGYRLYRDHAAGLPIYDYHCHLSAKEIAEDRRFDDVGMVMLEHDHYKWRLMRAAGIDEELITGNRSYEDKFAAYASAIEKALGNPLIVWTNMELRRYFGVTEPLRSGNAREIFRKVNAIMKDGSFTARRFIADSKVHLIATTDDPADDLAYHRIIARDESFQTKVVPTFRPDKALAVGNADYPVYLRRLGEAAKEDIDSLETLLRVLAKRMDHFEAAGCRISDHALAQVPDMSFDFSRADAVFRARIRAEEEKAGQDLRDTGFGISPEDASGFCGFVMKELASQYRKRGWAMQLHLFSIRDQNTRLASMTGPDSGFDSAGDPVLAAGRLCRFLDAISLNGGLPKTIIYTLEPGAYNAIITAAGSFTEGLPGRVQLGAAWWLCDHYEGIREQLRIFASNSALGVFNGMLTDSRSFLSYVRHDYFRRILCSFVGEYVENGQFPDDDKLLKELIEGVCFYNAEKYFGI